MKIPPEKEELLKNTVRNGMALSPLISIRKMQALVEHNLGRPISDKYVAKLMYKVRRQVVIQSDRKQLNERLAEVRDRHRAMMERLVQVAFWKYDFLKESNIQRPSIKEQIAAMKALSQMEQSLFRTELYTGAFESRRITINEILELEMLPPELRKQVAAVIKPLKPCPVSAPQIA